MKMMLSVRMMLICSGILLPDFLIAQYTSADTAVYRGAVNNAISLYHRSLGFQSALYNASAYPGYPFHFKEGHPFFFSDEKASGPIVYDGLLFDHQLLQYNEIADVVVLNLNGSVMQLVTEKVIRFRIFNNLFVRLTKDSSENGYISDGFYNLLYEGRVSLFGKEVKTIRDELRGGEEGIWRFIEIQNSYYIRRGKRFFPVKSRNDVLKIFAEKKTEIRQYIRTNKLKFRKDRPRTLTLVTAYFDQLIR